MHVDNASPAPTGEARQVEEGGVGRGLLIVLGLLSAIAPIATDLYLPAFPSMTGDLRTSATAVQLTLTAFLLGTAAGQLVFGPLSDRYGRLRPLLVGAVVCVLSSAVAALAPTVGVLTAARLVQGLSGAAGLVIGRAIISDLARGRTAAQAFSLMMIVGGVAPVLAPLVGGLLTDAIGWRGILWIVFALAVLMLVSVVAVVRESHPARLPGATPAPTGRRGFSGAQLLNRRYLGYTFAFAFAFAVMMAYISASPFVYQVMLGLSAAQYGLLFGVNALGLVVSSTLAARLGKRIATARLLATGLVLIVAATVALLVLVLAGAPVQWLPVPIFVAVASLGLVLGTATALALSAAAQVAGVASAGLGALQFGLAAVVSPLVSVQGEHTALPMAIVMVAAAVVALVAYLVAAAPLQRKGEPSLEQA